MIGRTVHTKVISMLKKAKNCFTNEITSDEYVNRLRKKGVSIGEGTRVFNPKTVTIDTQNPHMVKIGRNVRITQGCVVLTHDYSWSVIAGAYGEMLGGVGTVDIGSNVFIGINTIILKNTEIGDNVIIGAGSIASGKLESNSVYAGNPARKIMSLEHFYNKRKRAQISEIREINERYLQKYGKTPDTKVFQEYFWLFVDRESDLEDRYLETMRRTGYMEHCLNQFKNTEKILDLNALDTDTV